MTRFEAATREDARASLVLLLASLTRRHSCRLVRQVGAAQGTWGLPKGLRCWSNWATQPVGSSSESSTSSGSTPLRRPLLPGFSD
jgi:hypothetical protein